MATESKVRHLAIIMDGNGRWAQQHNLPRIEGHKAGARRVFDIMEEVQKFKIEYLTLYTFSTENWKRSPAEVAGLMNLLETELETRLPELMARGVRLKTIGRTAGLWNGPRVKLEKAIEATQNNRNGTLILALNYGGRAEIADAAQRIAQDAANGKLNPGSITEKNLCQLSLRPGTAGPGTDDPYFRRIAFK